MGDDLGPWTALEPADAARALDGVAVPWWIAGGWAVELHLGRRTRPQEDIDLGVWRDDVPAFTSGAAGWEFHAAKDGRLTPHPPGAALPCGAHILWARRPGGPWSLELLAEDRRAGWWTYRREPRVRRPADTLTRAVGAFRVIAPEVQLLYKSKDVRPKDQADFDLVAPTLDAPARRWLAEALAVAIPGHRWIAALGG